ncbi:hypothetical protein NM688_g1600 [Phlebia brevispora]|uniref:Uncharacterized protein n=1 Tax=Phlebia brevispora TaxID=194682 RepID=A0ACC1TBC9_9APHY|nr:hypothetical protein NM688_g1600 [Phlebia brevispora]
MHTSHVGTVTPQILHFMVTDTISTVVQFRAIDYGMEKCELNVLFPAAGSGEKSLGAISVYRLNTSYALDTSTLSYVMRPPRLPKLTDIPLSAFNNTHWRRTFVCPTESVLTFEFACSTTTGHSCDLEWWQDAKENMFGDSVSDEELNVLSRYSVLHQSSIHLAIPAQGVSILCASSSPAVMENAHTGKSLAYYLRRRPAVYVVVLAVALSLGLYYVTIYIITSRLRPWVMEDPLSFFPTYGDPVAMRIANTARFQLYTEEGMADLVHSLPSGGHLVYVRPEGNSGADPEAYTVTLFHQLRCLDVVRQGYTKVPEDPSPKLLHHCMNYLRQTILCRPHLLLEPVVTPGGLVSEAGYDGVCYNWEAVFEEAERNHQAYLDWHRRSTGQ